jgi:DNA-binding SARP family transcriptional activator
MRWRVELLGRLRITEHRAAGAPGLGPITRFQTRKTALLLAYLAYHGRRRPVPREGLIELFWPEGEPSAGRNSLSKALTSLRRQLEPPGVAAGAAILADREFVHLNPDAVVTDVAGFETFLDRAAKVGTNPARHHWLNEAVALYQATCCWVITRIGSYRNGSAWRIDSTQRSRI